MFEITGKYCTAKIFSDNVEAAAQGQILALCNQPVSEGAKIRIMPDVHAGVGCTIGTTMTITGRVIPNLVGVDIGCGMEAVRLREKHIELQQLDKLIRYRIPAGFSVRQGQHRFAKEFDSSRLLCIDKIHVPNLKLSIGSLGGGNHFIEADRGEDGSIWIVIHSGSRHLGVAVAKYYQDQAFRQRSEDPRLEEQALIARLKAEGKAQQIEEALFELRCMRKPIPQMLAYTEGALTDAYLHDMQLVQEFAALNRRAMMYEIIKGMKLHVEEQFTTVHNYIDLDHMILRKGAVSARQGERLLIPMNMRDGSLICTGKGNDDWNQSAPHGAGRLMSRSEAKQSFTVNEFHKQMKGIYTTSVGEGTLDECPMAYKPMQEIVENIADTVQIGEVIRPIYNFKAGE